MKYFITGANGFIGKNLCEKLLKDAHEIVAYDRTRPIQVPKDTEAIIHLGAEIVDSPSMFDTNVTLTYELLEIAKQLPNLKSFIYIGSSSEYGEKKLPMYEHDVLHPRTLYEATKGCGTLLTEAYARKYNLPTVIIRPFSIYGKYEASTRLIPTLFRALKTGDAVTISSGVHDFVYIDDFIDALLTIEKAIQNKIAPFGDIVNIGTGIETTNAEVVNLIEDITRQLIAVDYAPIKLRSYDSMHWKASNRKLTQVYGYKLQYDLKAGLTKIYNENYF